MQKTLDSAVGLCL